MFLFILPSFHSTHAGSSRTKPNFFSCTIWKTSLCFTDQKTQEKNLLSGNNSFSCRSVLTPIACKKFKIHSTHADSPRAQSNLFACTISQTSPCFIDQETQEENLLGGTNSFVGPCRSVLTLISCTKSKIHSTHTDSLRAQTNFFSCTIWKTSLCFTDRESQEENLLGGTNSFVGQFLHPSLVQSSRSIPHIQTAQGPKQLAIW